MLSDHIKALRKQKGFSQEWVAQQLHVVRQTVSKWEKGLSVPDAEMLEKLAELLEVPVSTLLGASLPQPDQPGMEQVVQQLTLLNEQLANQTRAKRQFWKKILIVPGSSAAAGILLLVLLIGLFAAAPSQEPTMKAEVFCTLNQEEYFYEMYYDDQYRIYAAGGDGWIADHVLPEQYTDAYVLIAQIEDYFLLRGGTCEVIRDINLEE